MFDALESEWEEARDKWMDKTSARYSKFVDDTIDLIFEDSLKYRPVKLILGMGDATLDVKELRGDEEVVDSYLHMCNDEDDGNEHNVRENINDFLTQVAMHTGYHDPFPATYSGKYA